MKNHIFSILFVLFCLELLVLIEVGTLIGPLNTIFAMLGMMIIGVVLIKSRFKSAMSALRTGRLDMKLALLPLAGFLFFFPGFISDVIALLLLIPSVQNRANTMFFTGTPFSASSPGDPFNEPFDDGYTDGKTIDAGSVEASELKDSEEHK